MPPEIVKGEPYDEKVDIWSAGVVVFVMLSGKPPFSGPDKPGVYKSIKSTPLQFPDSEWANISDVGKDFLRRAIEKDPTKRASAAELLEHPWMQE